jgi:chemotaxis protein methyltransferase CheR
VGVSERDADCSAFASWVEEHLGLRRDGAATGEWDGLLLQHLKASGVDTFAAYQARISTPSERRAELARLAERLTVGETYFFRESRQLTALATAALPELLRARDGGRVRILSVGCSSGEEPYSICITARELLGAAASRLEIVAFDANPAAIAEARAARYSDWSLRATPPSLRARWFQSARGEHRLADEIRGAVTFHVRNLFDDDPAFWIPRSVDVVFCRNILIYFSPAKITAALVRFASVLAKDGYLFLGHSETTRGYCDLLRAEPIAGAFCHRVIGAAAAPLPALALLDQDRQAPPATDATWVTTIDQATRRLEELFARVQTPPSLPPAPALPVLLEGLASLIQAERFADALARIAEIEAAAPGAQGALDLARAAILTNQGRLREAAERCRTLLARHPACAEAHYLLGLGCEHEGQAAQAQTHYHAAIEADPGLAMPHLKMGQVAARAGRRDEARQHFSQALGLLETQDAFRHGLLDGGFSREALAEMCVTGLRTCGGTR